MNLVVVSSKAYKHDFRKYLVEAASAAGDLAAHVHGWRCLNVTMAGHESPDAPLDIRHPDLLELARKFDGGRNTVVLTGMTAFRSSFGRSIKRILPHATFVYDVYDDFMYGTQGFKRLRRMQRDWMWRLHCHAYMVLEEGMLPRYPGSFHLTNASHMRPVPTDQREQAERVVYIGSIDVRTDFDWLLRLARSGVGIDIWGRPPSGGSTEQKLIDDLCAACSNVAFKGGYINDELPGILGHYRVGVLPYKTAHDWTRHINPDKLYHYLNSGLDVVATDIPQVRRMSDYLQVVGPEDDPAEAVRRALGEHRVARWDWQANSWSRRWQQLQQAMATRMR
jgi:hypothetical protein